MGPLVEELATPDEAAVAEARERAEVVAHQTRQVAANSEGEAVARKAAAPVESLGAARSTLRPPLLAYSQHWPGVPIYGAYTPGTGYVFGSNLIIGGLMLRQKRAPSESCSTDHSLYPVCTTMSSTDSEPFAPVVFSSPEEFFQRALGENQVCPEVSGNTTWLPPNIDEYWRIIYRDHNTTGTTKKYQMIGSAYLYCGPILGLYQRRLSTNASTDPRDVINEFEPRYVPPPGVGGNPSEFATALETNGVTATINQYCGEVEQNPSYSPNVLPLLQLSAFAPNFKHMCGESTGICMGNHVRRCYEGDMCVENKNGPGYSFVYGIAGHDPTFNQPASCQDMIICGVCYGLSPCFNIFNFFESADVYSRGLNPSLQGAAIAAERGSSEPWPYSSRRLSTTDRHSSISSSTTTTSSSSMHSSSSKAVPMVQKPWSELVAAATANDRDALVPKPVARNPGKAETPPPRHAAPPSRLLQLRDPRRLASGESCGPCRAPAPSGCGDCFSDHACASYDQATSTWAAPEWAWCSTHCVACKSCNVYSKCTAPNFTPGDVAAIQEEWEWLGNNMDINQVGKPYCSVKSPDPTGAYTFFMDTGIYGFPSDAQLCQLEQYQHRDHWYDFRSKQIVASFILYNGNREMYTLVDVEFIFWRGGRIQKFLKMSSLKVRNNYSTPADFGRLVLELIFLMMCMSFTALAVREFRAKGLKRFLVEGGLLEVIGQIFYIINIILWITICVTNMNYLQGSGQKEELKMAMSYDESRLTIGNTGLDLSRLRDLNKNYAITNQISMFINMFRVIGYFGFQPRLAIVTKTLAKCYYELYHFAIVFISLLVIFSFAGHITLGARIESFHTPAWAIQTLAMTSMGEWLDFEPIMRVNGWIGVVFYWTYILLMTMLLMNILLAIVIEGFMDAQEAPVHEENGSGGMKGAHSIFETISFIITTQRWKWRKAKDGGGGGGGGGGGDDISDVDDVTADNETDAHIEKALARSSAGTGRLVRTASKVKQRVSRDSIVSLQKKMKLGQNSEGGGDDNEGENGEGAATIDDLLAMLGVVEEEGEDAMTTTKKKKGGLAAITPIDGGLTPFPGVPGG